MSDAVVDPAPWWQELLDNSPDLVVVVDGDLVCRYTSLALTPLTGRHALYVIGREIGELFDPGDRGRVRDSLRVALCDDRPSQVTAAVRLGDGGVMSAHLAMRRYRRGERSFVITTVRQVASVADGPTLARKRRFEQVTDDVQERFIRASPGAIDAALNAALEDLALVVDADRSYLLEIDGAHVPTITHQWNRPGIDPRSSPSDTSTDEVEAPSASLIRLAIIHPIAIPDFTDSSASIGAAEPLMVSGLRSLAAYPIVVGGESVGILGFDWVRDVAGWADDEAVQLGRAAVTFANVVARQRSERALSATLGELRAAFDRSPAPLLLVDANGLVTRANDALQDLMAWAPGLIEGHPAIGLVDPADVGRFRHWASSLSGSVTDPPVIEGRVLRGDGEAVWMRVDVRVVLDHSGSVSHHVVQVNDITQRKQAEAALDESERRFRTLVDNLPDPVVRVTPSMSTVFANQAAHDLFDIDGLGNIRIDEETRRQSVKMASDALASGAPRRNEYRTLTRKGHRVLETRYIPELGPDGAPRSLLLVSTDLTEQRRTEAELTYRATHDSLTGLPNRSLFLTHLKVSLARLRRNDGLAAVIFFDLDHFKVVNDSLGHQAGDDLLVTVANRLRATLRPSDVVARLGGDEFTVLLDSCVSTAEVESMVIRLQTALAEPMVVAGRELAISSSAGIAIADRHTRSTDDLLAWADAAMYRAKGGGRARHSTVDDELLAKVQERLDMDQRLRTALERNELEVHYQPEVDLQTGEVLGTEALLRWNYDGRLISAAMFIALAEETRQIIPIGRWVLETACAQAAEWRRRSPERRLMMRVNISARQFDQPDLVEQVAEVLATSGIEPDLLCLEVTETALMADAATAAAVLHRLSALGVHLAIDDFGTGYSSLNYLKRFPVDVLKIDRSFVDGLPSDAEDAAIVTTIIRLAESLNMEVTAEGVETIGQAEALLERGCRRAQGFLYARPGPADVVTMLLDRCLPLDGELEDAAIGGAFEAPTTPRLAQLGTITTGHDA